MSVIKFEKYKADIQDAINKKISKNLISDPEGFILIDGFINIPIQNEIGEVGLVIGGPAIPAVSIVGKSSGLIYSFALKALLPHIEI